MTSCSICAENYNMTNYKPVSCLYCSFLACRSCCQIYILDQNKPKCMQPNCNKIDLLFSLN